MSSINFPELVDVGDEYTFGNQTWVWSGVAWEALRIVPIGATGPTGPTGATGSTGPAYYSSVNTQAGATYTLALSDAGDLVRTTSSSAVTVEVPTNDSVAFPVGSSVEILQAGTGQVTVVGASGVTVLTSDFAKTRNQYSLISAIKTATNEWVVIGDLAVV